MRYLLIILCMILLSAPAFAQGRVQNVDVDEIEDVRIDEDGRATLRFRIEDTGRLRADIFSAPSDTGAITVTFQARDQGDDPDKTTTLPTLWAPGRYEAVVQAVNPGAATIQLRITNEVPLDEYELNDTQETAMRVEMPFRGIVHLSNGDMDWFRVDPEPGGIVGVRILTTFLGSGPQFGFYQPNGEQILVTNNEGWGYRGMRYVRSTGRPIFIAVWDSRTFAEGDANGFKSLEIVQYRPEGAPASARSLVTLSLEDEDPSSFQLDLIGRAIGVDTVAADEADSIARELQSAIEGRGRNWGMIISIVVLLLLAGGGGYVFWRRRKA